MDYESAVELAPPGWRYFDFDDLQRLPEEVRVREMARVPPGERHLIERRDPHALERMLRASFWSLVYHLEPERWDALATSEPIHPKLLRALPDGVDVSIDVGAGSGRLTTHLLSRSARVYAVEPAEGLRRILQARAPAVVAIAGWAEQLPLPSHFAQLTVACGAFGPDPRVLAEMYRVTTSGGCVALISPEDPDWFEANCWSRIQAPKLPAPAHEAWIDEFFGPLDPPHELVLRRVR